MLVKKLLGKCWPYLVIILIVFGCFIYGIKNDGYFFYDDFTAFTFVVPRSYKQIVVDSLESKSVDRHKILGYAIIKFLYDTIGLEVNYYFTVLFVLHTVNSWLVFRLLYRLTGKKKISALVAAVYAYRFYLGWIANIENYLAGLFYYLSLHWWLDFNQSLNKKYLWLIYVAFPFLVYSYGSGVFLIPALLPLTVYLYGWPKLWRVMRYLAPLGVLFIIYVGIYIQAPDTATRFGLVNSPYYGSFTALTFALTQSIYLHLLSIWIPQSSYIMAAVWLVAFWFSRKHLLLFITFFLAIAPNSFFPLHTVYYYLYFPIVFILIYFARIISKRGLIPLIIFLAIFNPLADLKHTLLYLYYPPNFFHRQAMAKIVQITDQALQDGKRQVKLSNWDVTPNLHHAITYGAFPLWLHHSDKDKYIYGYVRETETLIITPKE